MEAETARRHAALLRIVAHPTRLMILDELSRGMKCVNDIQELLDVPQPNVSQHLAVLKDGDLLTCHKDGTARCYHLAKPGLVNDLFRMFRKNYPVSKVGNPERCRAARRALQRSSSAPQRRATAKA